MIRCTGTIFYECGCKIVMKDAVMNTKETQICAYHVKEII